MTKPKVSVLVANYNNQQYIKECISEKRKTLILSDRREHLKVLKKRIEEETEASSGYYLGGMKQELLKETEEKDIMLGTFSMASEGFDCKELDTIILASPKSMSSQHKKWDFSRLVSPSNKFFAFPRAALASATWPELINALAKHRYARAKFGSASIA